MTARVYILAACLIILIQGNLGKAASEGSDHSAQSGSNSSAEPSSDDSESTDAETSFGKKLEWAKTLFKDLEKRHKAKKQFGKTPEDVDSETKFNQELKTFVDEIRPLGARLSFQAFFEKVRGLEADFQNIKTDDPKRAEKEKEIIGEFDKDGKPKLDANGLPSGEVNKAFQKLIDAVTDAQLKGDGKDANAYAKALEYLKMAQKVRLNMMLMKKNTGEQTDGETKIPGVKPGETYYGSSKPEEPTKPNMGVGAITPNNAFDISGLSDTLKDFFAPKPSPSPTVGGLGANAIGNIIGNHIAGPVGGLVGSAVGDTLYNNGPSLTTKPETKPVESQPIEHERPFIGNQGETKPPPNDASNPPPSNSDVNGNQGANKEERPSPPTAENKPTASTPSSPSKEEPSSSGAVSSSPSSPTTGAGERAGRTPTPISSSPTGTGESDGEASRRGGDSGVLSNSNHPSGNKKAAKSGQPPAYLKSFNSERPKAESLPQSSKSIASTVSSDSLVRPSLSSSGLPSYNSGNFFKDSQNGSDTFFNSSPPVLGEPGPLAEPELSIPNVESPRLNGGTQAVASPTQDGFSNPVASVGRRVASIPTTPASQYKPLEYSGTGEVPKYAPSLPEPKLPQKQKNPELQGTNATYLPKPGFEPVEEELSLNINEFGQKLPMPEGEVDPEAPPTQKEVALASGLAAAINVLTGNKDPEGVLKALENVTNYKTNTSVVGEFTSPQKSSDLKGFMKEMVRREKPQDLLNIILQGLRGVKTDSPKAPTQKRASN